MPFVVTSSPVAHAQHHFASVPSWPEVQLSELNWSNNGSTIVDSNPVLQTPFPPIRPSFSESRSLRQDDGPRPSLMRRFQRKNSQRTALIVLLIILLVAASSSFGITFLLQKSMAISKPTGQVTFFDSQNGSPGHTNALSIVIHGLDTPPSGFQYNAWLINDQSEEVIALGTLSARQQTFSVSYAAESSNGQGGTNLLSAGDRLEITLEQEAVKLPAGKVILVGTFPAKAFSHIQHLLVSFPKTPGKIGVLVGVLEQTHRLNIQADVLQSNTDSGNTDAVQCAAQSIIDVIEGSKGPHYQPLPGKCALQNVTTTGDGFGLLGKGYVVDAAEHAVLATSQPDATNQMRLHEGLVEVALSNIKGWVTTVDQNAVDLLKNPTDLAKVQEIVMLSDTAYHGVDVNGDGQIDPVAGEAGALTAYLQGQLMASFTLVSNG